MHKKSRKIEILRTWHTLHANIMTLSEQELEDLLRHEKLTLGRRVIMFRIYNRMSKLRRVREHQELEAKARED